MPLPIARPSGLGTTVAAAAPSAPAATSARSRTRDVVTTASLPATDMALGYARPDEPAERKSIFGALGRLFSGDREPERPKFAGLGGGTAVYDISSKTVFMPDGTPLEAHSGLGELIDDPRHVAVKNKGATPPNVYRMVMRERLFHGVEAIRLLPHDGVNKFNRDGLLAHHYLLGPSGQSNGCVSFKDYDRFLAAFKAGKVKRMVVVRTLQELPVYVAML
ncbi:hypothetical protein A6302_03502 [Methylobrevis pamukkalensis]|uniref:Tlde1 domain-containing protein n=1 Tax=Methylobrevis pamukkalensis TaxID=1439726 RepID=A0A1E3GYS8_9HYPH|nr:hypothetical protein A6302_03502 [Methylobrevis pamukkalensis]